ncbi:MAG: hypothetical protein EBU90_15185 [Proteobacteria bacterium]|nr:hypothetical protein [Pseudomonadota bacterium]
MSIKISHWYGRLGNNIQQCAVGCMVAELMMSQFESIDHEIISKYQKSFGYNTQELSSKFFYWEGPYKEVNLPKDYIYHNMRRVCKEIVAPHLNLPSKKIITDDTIVIHIRSGDIFDQVHPNGHQYTPNPLYFYNKLLSNFEKAIVVTEPDKNNPIVEVLRQNPKVIVQSSSVAEDFATLMSAKNLANSGVGTFCVAAALCSDNVKNFYCTDLMLTEHLNCSMLMGTDITVHQLELNNYLKVGEWTNTKNQRNFILEYAL